MTKHVIEQLSITDVIAIPAEPKAEAPSASGATAEQGTSVAVGTKSAAPSHEDDPANDDFFGDNSDSRVLAEQPAIALYMNRRGDVVIRQERAWDQDEDRLVFVRPENLERFIQALQTYMPQSV